MQAKSDAQLLRDYAEQGSEAAFGEIVARHTDLVYSTALRQVSSPDLARDIAQSVFSDLAHKAQLLAGKLKEDASLVGWLYRGTRYTTLALLRHERRRQARERQAMEYLRFDPETSPDWEHVRPVLDEAMANLSDTDREALLLRFFKNLDFRAVGVAVGVSDGAAQKRVTRSLEKLRAELLRHGVTTTAAALSASISVHAVQAAPAGLAATLASASVAEAAVGTGITVTLLKSAVSKLQLGITGAAVIVSVVAPLVIQHRAEARLREKDERSRRENDRLAELRADNMRLSNLLAQARSSPVLSSEQYSDLMRFRNEVGRLRNRVRELTQLRRVSAISENDRLASVEKLWAERLERLKQWLEANPSEGIPELEFLSDRDWLNLIYPNVPETAEEYARAISHVRFNAERKILDRLIGALRRYVPDHRGQFPTDLSQLKSYFDSPMDDAILQRYQIVSASNLVSELQGYGDYVITQKAPVNEVLDRRLARGLTGGGMADRQVTNRWVFRP